MHSSIWETNGRQTATATSLPYDRNRSLHDIVRAHAQTFPDAVAVAMGSRAITYGELDQQSDALAARLLRIGVGKGDIVGIYMPRSIETIVAKLAALKAGAAYLPLDRAFPAEHIQYVINECAPKVVFVDSAASRKSLSDGSSPANIIDLSEPLPASNDAVVQLPKVDGRDTAYIMFTSGSTGRPKGVAISHRGITRLVHSQNYVRFDRDDVVLHTATIAFDAATFEIWGGLLNGCVLAIMPDTGLSLPRLCDTIHEHGVTVMLLTTGLFNLFADYASGDLPTLRHVFFGGEVGSAEHVRRFQKTHPDCRLTNAYGPTEGTVIATTFEVPPGFTGAELPIGKAIHNTRIHILDEDLSELPPHMEGQLAISGDGLAVGYFNQPELTAEKFVTIKSGGEWIRCYLTGDLAMLDSDGTVIFKGRRDRQIKINGKRIELDEIEAALRRDTRLLDAAVICHQEGAVKRIIAYLRPTRPSNVTDPDFPRIVMATLRNTLPAYMIPSASVVLSELPLTPAGKVERAKLPLPVVNVPAAAPQNRCEEIVVRLWREALGTDVASVDRNFFDLGGTSLQLLRIHAAIETELGQTIDISSLFQHTTIRDLVRFLEGKSSQTAGLLSVSQRAALQRKTMSQFHRSTS
jgi:amino acid adenylation domain-containing protein